MSSFRRALVGLLLLLGCLGPPTSLAGAAIGESDQLHAVRIDGSINPVVSAFVVEEVRKAHAETARAFLVELNTPGGLDTAMREIIQSLLASELPVIVYVSPSGARAASAGALITLSADFAVMAPGTNIGAATPIAIGPGQQQQQEGGAMQTKILNDAAAYARSIAQQRGRNPSWAEEVVREGVSTAAQEAVDLKVIDLVAEDLTALRDGLEGKTYLRQGAARQLRLTGAAIVYAEMTLRQRILNAVSNPTMAYLLMMLGILGIFFEISQPGVIFPGVIGALALLLALFALQALPISYVGALLILLGLILFLLEIKVVSFGMLTVAGAVALGFGSLMLIDSPDPALQISRGVILTTVLTFALLFGGCLYFVVRAQRSRFHSGQEGLVGEQGVAVTSVHEVGKVFIHGEYWDAFSEHPIPSDEYVEIVRLAQNMRLEVKKVQSDEK